MLAPVRAARVLGAFDRRAGDQPSPARRAASSVGWAASTTPLGSRPSPITTTRCPSALERLRRVRRPPIGVAAPDLARAPHAAAPQSPRTDLERRVGTLAEPDVAQVLHRQVVVRRRVGRRGEHERDLRRRPRFARVGEHDLGLPGVPAGARRAAPPAGARARASSCGTGSRSCPRADRASRARPGVRCALRDLDQDRREHRLEQPRARARPTPRSRRAAPRARAARAARTSARPRAAPRRAAAAPSRTRGARAR